jgi:hypothetical protein
MMKMWMMVLAMIRSEQMLLLLAAQVSEMDVAIPPLREIRVIEHRCSPRQQRRLRC